MVTWDGGRYRQDIAGSAMASEDGTGRKTENEQADCCRARVLLALGKGRQSAYRYRNAARGGKEKNGEDMRSCWNAICWAACYRSGISCVGACGPRGGRRGKHMLTGYGYSQRLPAAALALHALPAQAALMFVSRPRTPCCCIVAALRAI